MEAGCVRLSKEEAQKYGKRSGKRCREIRKVCIEGEYVNIDEIAARLGIGYAAACKRLQRAQRKPGAVTWAGLS
jgi:predicted ArsR family transcriptional regulator